MLIAPQIIGGQVSRPPHVLTDELTFGKSVNYGEGESLLDLLVLLVRVIGGLNRGWR